MLPIIATASLLTGVGVAYSPLWWLSLSGIALFLYALWYHTPSLKVAVLYAALIAFVSSAASIIWFWSAYPLSWLQVGGAGVQIAIIFLTWFATALFMSVGPTLAGLGIYALRSSPYRIIVAACLWIIGEELRMWGFSLLTYASDSLVGPHFSIASLGYLLSESSFFLQAAPLGGVHVLTFLFVLLAGCIASLVWWPHHIRERILTAACFFCVLTAPILGTLLYKPTPSGTPVTVALISTRDPVDPTTTDLNASAHALIQQAFAQNPDVVVFPENYAVSPLLPSHVKSVDHEILVIGSGHTPRPDGTHTLDLAYDSTLYGRIKTHSKKFLMPLGEFAPLLAYPLFSVVPSTDVRSYLDRLSGVRIKGNDAVVVPFKGHIFGGLVCSEALSPYLYRPLVAQGADILINSANPGWFRGSPLLHQKMIQVGRVHAVEHRAHYLMASNDLPAFAINPYGEILVETPSDTAGIVQVTVP